MKKTLCHALCLLLPLLLALSLTIPARATPRHLRVAVNCTLPPYQFLSQEGKCIGMHIDMLNEIAKDKGFFLEYLPMNTARQCMDALAAGEVNLVLGVISTSVEGESCDLSDSLSTATLSLLADKGRLAKSFDPSHTSPRTAVFSVDTARNTLLSNLGFTQYLVVGDQIQVFERQRGEEISAFIGLRESLLYQIKEIDALDDYVTLREYLDSVNFVIAVKRGDRELLRGLNEGVARFRSDVRYATVYKKWIVQETEEQWRVTFRRALAASAFAAVLLVGYTTFTTRLRRLLQRKVGEQTQEIQDSKGQIELQMAQLQSENDLRNRIIKYSPSAMLLFDSSYRIALMNKRAQTMTGLFPNYGEADPRELPVFGKILQLEGEQLFTRSALPENQSLRLEDAGEYRSYRYTMHQVVQYGKINLILLTVQDVTAEERSRQAAFEEEKSRTLNRVVAGIAHEIRNPLTAISTFATLVGSNGDDREVQESFATHVPREVERINRLIEGLIHYAKPLKPRLERMEVDNLVEECLALIRPVLKKSGVGFRYDCAENLFIIADRDQFKQILVNLLMNGLEAIEKRRQRRPEEAALALCLIGYAEEHWAVLTLRDQGTGMSPEEIRRCTAPFFSTKDRGTGLGLALCQQYIADNGGTMDIESVEMSYTEITLRFRRVAS